MIDVAVATNMRYLPWCATLLLSCVEEAGAPVRVHLLTEGPLPPDAESALDEMVHDAGGDLHPVPVGPWALERLPSAGRFGGRTAALRLLLPELVPGVDRIIYLDADTLVVAPLEELWGTPLEGLPLAAVPNVVEPAMYAHTRTLGIDDPKRVFNSGVLLIDLRTVRAEGSFEDVIAELTSPKTPMPWFDQDALNVVFAGRWRRLHPRWNAMNSLWLWNPWANEVFGAGEVDEARNDPAILHFEGPAFCKPWHYLNTHPRRDEYRSLLARTPWAGTPLEERTLGTRFVSKLPADWQISAYWRLHRARAWFARGRPAEAASSDRSA